MKVYLVGGAVRDELLGRPVGERDWVVVGATPQQMLDARLPPGRPRFPGVPAPGDRRGVRARAHRAQDRARLSRLRAAFLARRHARGRPDAPRPHDQRDGARRRRRRWSIPHGGRARPRGAQAPARVRRLQRGSGADPARRALPRALRAARLHDRAGDAGAHARDGRRRRGGRARAGTHLAGNRARARGAGARRLAAGAARLRRAGAHLPGARCALRRAAAGEVAPGDRHRPAHGTRAAGRGRADAGAPHPLRRADARPRQGPHAALAVAAAHRPRGIGRAPRRARSRSGCACRRTTATSPCSPRAGTASCTAPSSCGRARCWSCSSPATRSGGRSGSASCSSPAKRTTAGAAACAGEPYPQADRLRAAQARAAAVALDDADREGLSGEKIGELLRRRRLAALKSAA